jgi:hypothetical protein
MNQGLIHKYFVLDMIDPSVVKIAAVDLLVVKQVTITVGIDFSTQAINMHVNEAPAPALIPDGRGHVLII